MSADNSIEFVYEDRDVDPDGKVFGGTDPVLRIAEVSAERLADSVARLGETMDIVLDRVRTARGDYELESLEVSAELTGSGEVRLIAATSLAATGAIRLTFKKKDQKASS